MSYVGSTHYTDYFTKRCGYAIIVKGKLLPVQCDMDGASKALLKLVRCNYNMGCDILPCSCRKAGLDCSTGCGECRGICANMYDIITEDNENDTTFLYSALIRTIRWSNNVFMASILNFREIFGLEYNYLVTKT